MSNLTMANAIELYSNYKPENKTIQLEDMTIVVTPVLASTEVKDFVFQAIDSINSVYETQGAIVNIDYFIRALTVIKYTNFKLEDVKTVEDIERLTEFLYGTPLYAMLVGAPCRPVYFNEKKYITPLVDIEQYMAILRTIENTIPKYLKWDMNGLGDDSNEKTEEIN